MMERSSLCALQEKGICGRWGIPGDATRPAQQRPTALGTRYPRMDSYVENIHVYDPHLFAFKNLSSFENFSRIEMVRKNENVA